MASAAILTPKWASQPPAAFDLVTCYYPEAQPQPDGSFKLRPALVLNVFRDEEGTVFCEVAYGTRTLKLTSPLAQLDLVVQNAADLRILGLHVATRFVLDKKDILILEWCALNFGCWGQRTSPRIGALTEDYLRNFAYCMALRRQREQMAAQARGEK